MLELKNSQNAFEKAFESINLLTGWIEVEIGSANPLAAQDAADLKDKGFGKELERL